MASMKNYCWPQRTQRLVSHLPKHILMIPETFGKTFCGLTRQMPNLLCCYFWCKTNTQFYKKNCCFVASRRLAIIGETLNSVPWSKQAQVQSESFFSLNKWNQHFVYILLTNIYIKKSKICKCDNRKTNTRNQELVLYMLLVYLGSCTHSRTE